MSPKLCFILYIVYGEYNVKSIKRIKLKESDVKSLKEILGSIANVEQFTPPYLSLDSTALYVYINKKKFRFDLDQIISEQFRYDPFPEDYEPLLELMEFIWEKVGKDSLPNYLGTPNFNPPGR